MHDLSINHVIFFSSIGEADRSLCLWS